MSDNPQLYYWIYLLPVVLLVFWFIRRQDGKLTSSDLVAQSVAAGVGYFVMWRMGMFRLLIFPLLLLTFGFLVWALVRAKKPGKILAGVLLGLFFVTGLYAYHVRSKHGAIWELEKRQSTSGSFGWLPNAAKEKRFTRAQLLKYVKSSEPQLRENARAIAALQGKEESDMAASVEFYQALEAVDSELAKNYFDNIEGELRWEVGEALGLLSSRRKSQR